MDSTFVTCPRCAVVVNLVSARPEKVKFERAGRTVQQETVYCPVCNAVVFRVLGGAISYPLSLRLAPEPELEGFPDPEPELEGFPDPDAEPPL